MQFNEHSHFDSVDDYRSRVEYDSTYDGSSTRVAPMDELQDDFNVQMRLNEEDLYERRVFGKEIPRLTQDYGDYGRPAENTYELEKTNSYDVRRVAEISSRDREYFHGDTSPPFMHQNGFVYSNNTRWESSQGEVQYQKNTHRSSSQQRASSRQRANSRQRSVAQDHDHCHHHVDPRLYDRSGPPKHKHDLRTRSSDQFLHMKPQVRDENRQYPAGVTNWFLENVVGTVQGGNVTQVPTPKNSTKIPREKAVHRPKLRQHMPPVPRHFENGNQQVVDGFSALGSHCYENSDYYHDNEERYDENENHNDRAISRRISSMR